MFNKRKQKKAQRAQDLSESHIRIEKQLHVAILKAGLMEEPAEKVIMLQAISRDISQYLRDRCEALPEETFKTERDVYAGTAITSMAGGMLVPIVGATVGLAPVIGLPLMLGGFVGGLGISAIASRREKSVTRKVEKSIAGHSENMKRLQKLANVMTDITIEHNVKEISKSPLCGKVLALPGITEKFANAAGKYLAVEEVPAIAETVPPAEDEQKVHKRRDSPNYKHLDGVIKPNKP